jgi:hypothetical protein
VALKNAIMNCLSASGPEILDAHCSTNETTGVIVVVFNLNDADAVSSKSWKYVRVTLI